MAPVRSIIPKQDAVRLNIEKMLKKLTARPNEEEQHYSIYRVPANIRDSVDKKHYEPKLVSIGPYYRGKDHLRAMEERKHLYLRKFLDDSKPGVLQECIDELRAAEPRARACYFESAVLSSDDLVEMLLLDGCFVLQFFIQWFCGTTDPIFNVGWNLPLLHTDLLLLENQIPYFVLTSLYGIYSRDPDRPESARPKKSLTYIITEYWNDKVFRAVSTSACAQRQDEENIDHLLHLYYCHFVIPPSDIAVALDGTARPAPRTLRSAKELRQHGVWFEQKEAGSILNVTFRDGVFYIPPVAIDETTCTWYMNLVAFEQCHDDLEKHFTSYVVLMDYLINTTDDVLILDRRGVLVNKLANEEDAAQFFNQLRGCSYINYDTHYLARVYIDVDAFCSHRWPKYKAKFRRDYVNSPWAIIGFVLASLFAVFTVFNTIISILQTFFHLLK